MESDRPMSSLILTSTASGLARYDRSHPFGYHGGTFSDDEVERALAEHGPLTMDFSIPGRCLNNCPYCGYYAVNNDGKLAHREVLDVIAQFASLGGRSVKILGEGEPLLRFDICEILAAIGNHGLIPVLFTCGDVLGDKQLCARIHGSTCQELSRHLFSLGCTIVLKFESWQQDDIVRRPGYSDLRNRALRTLLDLGFNSTYPTRLGFGIVLLRQNYGQILEIYSFALQHNIYPLICPLMPIGRSKSKAWRTRIAPTPLETQHLKQRLIKTRSRYSNDTFEDSDFPGGLPCDVARCGMYIDDAGNAFLCESDELAGNARAEEFRSIWQRIDALKSSKYGHEREAGLCSPKRRSGII